MSSKKSSKNSQTYTLEEVCRFGAELSGLKSLEEFIRKPTQERVNFILNYSHLIAKFADLRLQSIQKKVSNACKFALMLKENNIDAEEDVRLVRGYFEAVKKICPTLDLYPEIGQVVSTIAASQIIMRRILDQIGVLKSTVCKPLSEDVLYELARKYTPNEIIESVQS